MKKSTSYSILAGIVIIAGFSILSYYVLQVEAKEIENDKERIFELVMEAVITQNRNMDVFADMIGAFYEGSELVTEEEFEIFVNHMLSDVSEIKNIAVMRDDRIIQSHPVRDTSLFASELDSDVLVLDGEKTILVRHREKNSNLVVILFADPAKLIPLQNILQEPYKVELSIPNNILFYEEAGVEDGGFSEHQAENLLVVKEKVEFLEHGGPNGQTLTYRIWEGGFDINYYPPALVLGLGFAVSGTVSFLVFRTIKSRELLHEQKEEIQKANETLATNQQLLKKTQSLLLESEEKYRNLFNLSPLGISVISLDGKITSCNDMTSQEFGYDKDEIVGRHFTDFVAERDIHRSTRLFENVLSEGTIKEEQVYCKKKDGTEFLTVINAAIMKDKNSKTSGVICIISMP